MPPILPPVDYETFRERVCAGETAVLGWLNQVAGDDAKRKDDYEKQLPRLFGTWFNLLKTDVIQDWLLSNDWRWAKSARSNGVPELHPVLSLLLRRHLLHLGTRRDVSKLDEFWRWVTDEKPSGWRNFWQDLSFAGTIGPADSAVDPKAIVEQETAFVELLSEAVRRFQTLRLDQDFPWAMDTVQRLIVERRLTHDSQQRNPATVRVVFAFKDPNPVLRPGIVVTFRMQGTATALEFLKPGEVFDEPFRHSLGLVRSRIGGEDFKVRILEHDWGWLPNGFLQDTSGSLAIWLAQFVAAGLHGDQRSTLPPWLVMTATLDPHEEGIGGGAAKVGLIEHKLQTLVEEGIRVAYVAADRTTSTLDAPPDLVCLPVRTVPEKGAFASGRPVVESLAQKIRGCGWLYPAEFPDSASLVTPPTGVDEDLAFESQDILDSCEERERWPQEFVPPTYILDRLATELQGMAAKRGYLELIAPSMWGKSRLMLALRHGWLRRDHAECGTTLRVVSLRRGASHHNELASEHDGAVDWLVLGYAVMPGALADPGEFFTQIYEQAREMPRYADRHQRPLGDRELPHLDQKRTVEEIRQALVRLLAVVRDNCCAPDQPLVLSVDGLDELSSRAMSDDPNRPALLDVLPRPHELPEQCFLLLTRRSGDLARGIREALDDCLDGRTLEERLSKRKPIRALPREQCYASVELVPDADAAAQDAVIREFVSHSLEAMWPTRLTATPSACAPADPSNDEAQPAARAHADGVKRAGLIDAILERSEHSFLNARMIIDTLRWNREQSADASLPTIESLPAADAIFSTALKALEQVVNHRHGNHFFEHWHRPVLGFVTVAYEPITRQHLRCWLSRRMDALVRPQPNGTDEGVHPTPPPVHDSWDKHANERLHQTLIGLASFLRINRSHDDHNQRLIIPAHRELMDWLHHTSESTWSNLVTASHQIIIAAAEAQPWPDESEDVATLDTESTRYHLLHTFTHFVALDNFAAAEGWHDQHDPLAFRLGVWSWEQERFIRAACIWNTLATQYKVRIQRIGGLTAAIAENWRLVNDLASTLNNCGVARQSQSDFAESVADYDESARLRRRVIDEPSTLKWNPTLIDDVAMTLMNLGGARLGQGDFAESVAALDESARLRQRLIDESFGGEDLAVASQPMLVNELAKTLMNRGISQRAQGNYADSVADCDESARLSQRLIDETFGGEDAAVTSQPTLVNDLAMTLIDRGVARKALGDFSGRMDDYERSARLMRRLIDETFDGEDAAVTSQPKLVNNLAGTLMNRGIARRDQGNFAGSDADYDESARLRQRLIDETFGGEDAAVTSHPTLVDDLAATLMSRGIARWDQGDFADSVADFDESARLRQRLIDETFGGEDAAVTSHPTLVRDLAATLMSRSVALWSWGDIAESVADHDESARMMWRLIKETFGGEDAAVKWNPRLIDDLAATLTNRGNSWHEQEDFAESVADYDEAARLRGRLIDETFGGEDAAVKWNPWLIESLATTLLNCGNVRRDQEAFAESVADYDEAARLWRRLIDEIFGGEDAAVKWKPRLIDGLATTLMNRGIARQNQEDFAESVADNDESDRLRQLRSST